MSTIQIAETKQIDEWLAQYGYDDVEQMQEFYGLKTDGFCGPVTLSAMSRPRCGVQDFGVQADCKWGKRDFLYWNGRGGFSLFHKEMPRGRSRVQSADMIDEGFKRWASVLPGFSFSRTQDAAACDMWIGGGSGRRQGFDGPGRVLAWAYMPCGPDSEKLESRFDMDEHFTYNSGKRHQDPWVLAWSVWLHELGHLLGLDHSSNPNDLMAPYYDPDIVDLQPGDVRRIQKLYGIVG
jgi:hypothetical protein